MAPEYPATLTRWRRCATCHWWHRLLGMDRGICGGTDPWGRPWAVRTGPDDGAECDGWNEQRR